MEKYRAKQQRSWNEVASRLRQLTGGKRPYLEREEHDQLLRCLGLLQKSIKIKSAQNMIERLDNITRQLGLKLTKDRKRVTDNQPVEFEVFISSDMFYVEVMIEASGHVRDVKIAHHGDPVRCPELCSVLQANDFASFKAHLEGLIAIYRLNCDKSAKQKAYVALQTLEKKLLSMVSNQSQNETTDVNDLVFKSAVGVLVPRRGGFPMQLTYFVSPYDFVTATGDRLPFSADCITKKKLGQRVSISIENSTSAQGASDRVHSHQFPPEAGGGAPAAKPQVQSFPIHGASYTMKLSSPLAVDVECLAKIEAVTGVEIAVESESQLLVDLITGRGPDNRGKAFHVKLPDQNHTFYVADGARMGVVVHSIQFTSSKQIPPVLDLLRRQCFFNCLIASCVRDFEPDPETEYCHVFEINPIGLNAVCVSFEHPLDSESLMILKLSFDNIFDPSSSSSLIKNDKTKSFITDAQISMALQMSFSIPVVMRSIVNRANALRKSTETLKNQSSGSSIVSYDAAAGHQLQENPFLDLETASSENSTATDSMRQKLFELENFCQQDGLGLTPSLNDFGPGSDFDPAQQLQLQLQQQQQQQQQQSNVGEQSIKISNQQGAFDLIDDSMFFDGAYPRDSSGNEIVQQGSNCVPDRLQSEQPQFNNPESQSPSASGERFRTYNSCADGGQHSGLDGNMVNVLPPSGRQFDSNQKNLLTGGDSSESPPAAIIQASNRMTIQSSTFAGGATLTAVPAGARIGDDRKDSSKVSSKSKKSSSSHAKKKERSSSKDRSSTKSSGSSSKSSSSKSSSSKDKKRSSGDGSSGGGGIGGGGGGGGGSSSGNSRSSLVAGFDRSHQSNLKRDSSLPSKHSSTSDKQFTVRQSSSAQGMKLTINKARTPESESRSSSSTSSSSKHHRSSSKSKVPQGSVSHHQMKQSSSLGKISPKHPTLSVTGAAGGGQIPVDDENDAIDLVEKRLRALHGDEASMNHFAAARAPTSGPTVSNRLFEDAFME